MVIKTFEYNVLNSFSQQTETTEKKTFSLDVAEKATYIVHRALRTANRNRSQTTSSTKTKSEVQGGGRKPWKQKGTGNARAGSNRSPLWRGGGITFGPKPRLISKKINKKEKQLALRTLIYNKNKEFQVFSNINLENAKTSTFIKNFKNFTINEKILVISSKPNKNLKLSIQNCKNFQYILANQLNVTELAKANKVILDEMSFQIIKETYCATN
jgi:large subunit ribosomal protein L4